MKLNKHQKEIVKKILANEVYDTYSYLKCFKKLHIEKYDMTKLEEAFKKSENGKQYKVMKEGFHSFIKTSNTQNILGSQFSVPITMPRSNIPEDEWEYKDAKFNPNIIPIEYPYNDENFRFDFVKDNIEILNDFQDLIDFFALWTFLVREALVFELEKPVTATEIGLFFKSKPVNKQKNKLKITINGFDENGNEKQDTIISKIDNDYYEHGFPPSRHANEFIENTWEIDEEKLIMSKDYIGKKIIPTSSLHTYAQSRFKTFEERSQNKNLIVAWIAVVISVISVFLGNILPLTQTDTTDYIISIEQQISELNQKFDSSTIDEILEVLSSIKQELNTVELSKNQTVISEILVRIEEIEKVILKNEP